MVVVVLDITSCMHARWLAGAVTPNLATPTHAMAGVGTFTDATAEVATPTDAMAEVATPTDATAGVAMPIDATAELATPTDATAELATPTHVTVGVATPIWRRPPTPQRQHAGVLSSSSSVVGSYSRAEDIPGIMWNTHAHLVC